jgi:hypothetical protein
MSWLLTRRGKRRGAWVLATVAAVAICATAAAFLLSTGSGTANGSVTASTTVTISGGTTTQTLIPSTSATGDVVATIQNTSNSPLHVGSLVLDVLRGTGGYSSNAAACAVTYTPQSNDGSGWTIAAGATSALDLTNSVTMGTTAPSSCQGQTFTIFLKTA